MIDEAWRDGRVLTLDLGWAGYPKVGDTDLAWIDAADSDALAQLVPVSEGPGSAPVYVARDLIPLLRRGMTVTRHTLFGLWPRIALVPTLP